MSDAVISLGGTIGLMLGIGLLMGLADRKGFSLRWLAIAAVLVVINDVLLTRFYGATPGIFPQAEWNWQGKALALIATLAIAAMPAFGWKRCGLTLRQAPGSLRASIPVVLIYLSIFVAVALAFPNDELSAETLAFQATMPGIEEETFYRGLLLFAVYEAFRGRFRWLGIDWSWGAVLSCILFGLAHAFSYSDGAFGFDPAYMAFTAIPAFLAVWLRMRTGSVLLPILVHNTGNLILQTL